MDEATHRVAVFGTPDDPHALRDVLVSHLELHPTDAQLHAHAVPGLLPDRLPETRAIELAEAIEQLGVTANVVAQSDLPDLVHPQRVHHARCREEGLAIVDLRGDESEIVPWGDVVLWSIGYVPLHAYRRDEAQDVTFLHATPRPPLHATPVEASGPEMLFVLASDHRCLEVPHDEMNYEYLGERKTDSATANFRLFAEDVERSAAGANATPAAHAFLHHGQLRHYAFGSSDEHRHYVEFHVLVRRALGS